MINGSSYDDVTLIKVCVFTKRILNFKEITTVYIVRTLVDVLNNYKIELYLYE